MKLSSSEDRQQTVAVHGYRNINRRNDSSAGQKKRKKKIRGKGRTHAWLFQCIHKDGEEIKSYEVELQYMTVVQYARREPKRRRT
jgi:hypothetical protein